MTHIITCGLHYCLPNMDVTVEDNTTRSGSRRSVNYLAMDSAREAERAVQSFAVQPSLLRRVRQTMTSEEDESDAFLSLQMTAPLSPHLSRCP